RALDQGSLTLGGERRKRRVGLPVLQVAPVDQPHIDVEALTSTMSRCASPVPLGRVQVGEGDADSDFDFAGCEERHPRKRRSGGVVLCAGGCDEFRCVRVVFVTGTHPPAGCFLLVVAPFTQSEPVLYRGGSATLMGLGVVAVPDRGVAVGRAAGLV